MRISDWSSDVCSSDVVLDEEALAARFSVSRTPVREAVLQLIQSGLVEKESRRSATVAKLDLRRLIHVFETISELEGLCARFAARRMTASERGELRSEEHTSELQSLMRISYGVFCLK